MCLACTQQIYFDCRARKRGEDIPVNDAERYAWINGLTPFETDEYAARLAERYSLVAAAKAFEKYGIDVAYELGKLRAIAGSKGPKSTAAIRLRAIEAIQALRREFLLGPTPTQSSNPSTNGTVPVTTGFPKDDWPGRQL